MMKRLFLSTKNLMLLSTAVFLLLAFPSAQAQEAGATLVETARCYICHQASDASLGPPWQAIAARHALRKDLMVDVLARKIVNGGGGNWGLVPMVPNQRVSIEEARTMAAWVLEQK